MSKYDTFLVRLEKVIEETDARREERQAINAHVRSECGKIREQQVCLAELLDVYEEIGRTL